MIEVSQGGLWCYRCIFRVKKLLCQSDRGIGTILWYYQVSISGDATTTTTATATTNTAAAATTLLPLLCIPLTYYFEVFLCIPVWWLHLLLGIPLWWILRVKSLFRSGLRFLLCLLLTCLNSILVHTTKRGGYHDGLFGSLHWKVT